MIDIFLTPSEHRQYLDLYKGAGQFAMPPDADAATKNERAIVALESVLPSVDVRATLGTEDFNVLRRVSAFTERFRRIGVAGVRT